MAYVMIVPVHGTESEWTAAGCVPGAGELCVQDNADGTHVLKLGDGATLFSDLPSLALAASVTVGTVTTLPAGSAATVVNSGTDREAVLDIGIPRGAAGASGDGSGDMVASVYDPQGKSTDIFAAIAALKTALTAVVPASGWSTSAPYTQTVAVAGLTAEMHPVADVVLSGTQATDEAALAAWGCVQYMVCGAGTLTLTCYSAAPKTDFSVLLKELW